MSELLWGHHRFMHQMGFLVEFKVGDEVEHLMHGSGVVEEIVVRLNEEHPTGEVRYLVKVAKGTLPFHMGELHEPGTIAFVNRNNGRIGNE